MSKNNRKSRRRSNNSNATKQNDFSKKLQNLEEPVLNQAASFWDTHLDTPLSTTITTVILSNMIMVIYCAFTALQSISPDDLFSFVISCFFPGTATLGISIALQNFPYTRKSGDRALYSLTYVLIILTFGYTLCCALIREPISNRFFILFIFLTVSINICCIISAMQIQSRLK